MHENPLRALFLGLIVAGLALSPWSDPAFAEDEQPDAPEAEGIAWVDGWEAGQAKAREAGKLIFLYFGRHAPR